jgi:phosphopantothenoylcysteine decarboxylase/phosphopantothenate--cysteine ligase
MNVKMWDNSILQQNVSELKKLGYEFIAPGTGDLACGDMGKGRMAEPEDIIKRVSGLLSEKKDLEGKTILVTAGRTEESLDPVRYISNRSSGKMGYAVAERAKGRGAVVILISGPSSLNLPGGVDFVSIRTANQMRDEVKKHFKRCNCLVMTAAVSDFAPEEVSNKKLKRSDNLNLRLKSTPGILEEIGKRKGKKVMVGFSLETENEIENAKLKLKKKNLDLIVVNNPNTPGSGFELDTNVVTIIDKRGKAQKLPLMTKMDLADRILDKISSLLKRK